MIINTKGVMVYLSKANGTPVPLVPTAITSAKPAVVTVASVAAIKPGDIVEVGAVGFNELNNKLFVVGKVTALANTFELVGSNTTTTTGTLNSAPKMTVHTAADQVRLCLSGMDIAAPSTNEIDVSTFCKEGTLPGKVTPGTVSLSGYADKDDDGLAELIAADADGVSRFFQIVLPGTGNGYLVGQLTLSGLSFNVPLEGAVGFTLTGSQTERIRWVR